MLDSQDYLKNLKDEAKSEREGLHLEEDQQVDQLQESLEHPEEPEIEQQKQEAVNQEEPEVASSQSSDDDEPEFSDEKSQKGWAKLRQEAKEAKRRERELSERLAKLEGRLEAQIQPAPEREIEDLEPDQEYEPEKWAIWKIRQQEKKIESLEQGSNQFQQQATHRQEVNEFQNVESRYMQENPDYDNAAKYLLGREKTLAQMQYPNASEEEINSYLQGKVMDIYRSYGPKSPDIIMTMAKESGYSTKDSSPKSGPNIEKVNRNMKKSGTLIGGSPQGDASKLSSDQVFKMSLDKLAGNPNAIKDAQKNFLKRGV